MKIFGWRADNAGCGWWRIAVPADALAARGHEVGHSITFTADWDDADVIIGQRVCTPGPSLRWQEWAQQGRFLVYDVDDDWWSVELTAPNGLFWARRDVRERIIANIRAASRVTTCSPRLAEIVSAYHPDVVVVPNGVPERLLRAPAKPSDQVTVGWSGTASTIAELPLAARSLKRLLDRQAQAGVHTVGVHPTRVAKAGLRHGRVRSTGPVPAPDEYLQAIDYDVWVAPYRSTPFNRAKAPTKFLEASALGIPIVASAIDPYEQAIEHGVTGFLVKHDHDWDTYLRLLAQDSDLRQAIGAQARARVQSAEDIAPLWERALTP